MSAVSHSPSAPAPTEERTTSPSQHPYNAPTCDVSAGGQQAMWEGGTEYHAHSPISSDCEQEDDHLDDTSTTSMDRASQRTLRRTTRSRRIHRSLSGLQLDQSGAAESKADRTHDLQSSRRGSNASPASSEDEWEECEQYSNSKAQDDQQEETMQHQSRHAYPLQAPVSNGNLSGTQFETKLPNERPNRSDQTSKDVQAAMRRSKGQRQVYPLQSPASKSHLGGSPTPPPSSPESEFRPASTQSQRRDDVPKKKTKNIPSRQAYPLQAPASVANLQRPLSPPTSPERSSEYERAFMSESVGSVGGQSQSKAYKRQPYPLQAQASVAELQRPTSTSSSNASELENVRQKDELQQHEAAVASKVVNQWRAHAHEKQEPVHLPQNMRAASNGKDHNHGGRTIVVCLDGTGDKFDNDNSNIVHLVSALKKDAANQVSYYQAGIGTYGEGGLSGGFSAAMDMAVGSGLGLHVRDAYNFLMHSYKEGDKICIFGFSRGAYTARCLAGMIHKVGLLPARNLEQIPFAYQFYADDTAQGWKQSEDFKSTFCIDVCVHFLGCFDSVASVGLIPRQLPLSSTPGSKPRYFRHAMALDERRSKFKICRHRKMDWEDIEGTEDEKSTHVNLSDEEYNRLVGNHDPFDTDVLEVWFAGAHADVGGGAVPNAERHKLAQIPLRWMIRQAFECNTGIVFKTAVLAEHGLDVHTLWPNYRSLSIPDSGPPASMLERYEKGLPPRSIRRGKLVPSDRHEQGEQLLHLNSPHDDDWTPEQLEDYFDALGTVNDQLVQAPNWWILEMLPVEYKVPTTPGKFVMQMGMNLGRYRGVEDVQPKVHWTVAHRSQQLGYQIQVRTAKDVTWKSVV
ncbi:uncharacterized protein LTR77_006550 [Saxophila tyrrhenica]|uniref:T6SS Phospholipase effector Tle1-like catalytic domain-containing protein n=1 Tax=Saxophila tyrrhenica TaxID=1690608 RepID=A0AAV9P833_9PEZI|nr:hypothetical protein LTR77_006550 [Saxophila tyrrhenica]